MQERDVPGPRGAQVTIDGSTAVVTGASTGIGRATAIALRDRGSGAYAASKAAVDLLSRTAFRELRDHGVHVVNVKPALTDTRFSATSRGDSGRRMGGDPPEKVARWICEALESGSATAGYR